MWPLKKKDKQPKWKDLTPQEKFNRVTGKVGNTLINSLAAEMNMIILLGICAVPTSEYFQSCTIDADESTLSALFEKPHRQSLAAYPAILSQNQYTVFGDSNHTDPRIRTWFFGQENVQTTIENGVKHVFIEYPQSLQDIVDEFTNGVITKNDLVEKLSDKVQPLWWTKEQSIQFHSQMADAIMAWHEAGVQMHFADAMLEDSELTAEDFAVVKDMASSLAAYKNQTCPDNNVMDSKILIGHSLVYNFRQIINNGLSRDTLEQLRENSESQKKLVEERYQNEELARRIQNIAQDEKSIILYGSAHSLHSSHDLDELLGRENTAVVELYGDQDIYADRIMSLLRPLHIKQPADHIHLIDQNTVFQNNPEKAMRPRAPVPSS